ncbi:hypothetical protein V8F06_012770 [Rhypophila decipiens]
MSPWSPRRSAYLALSLLVAVLALTSAYPSLILPRQPIPEQTVCTCSSKKAGLSRIRGICTAAGGDEALITVYAEPNEENAGYPPRVSWNECYFRGKLNPKAIAAFSDANCAAKFGEGYTGDCVPYPYDPGFANIQFPPPPYCKKGREALPNCPLTGPSACGANPFNIPRCCMEIQSICGY